MKLNKFEHKVVQAHYHQDDPLTEALLGLAEETGEVLQLFKKSLRYNQEFTREELISELGDVLHYTTFLARYFEITIDELVEYNIKKIEGCKETK